MVSTTCLLSHHSSLASLGALTSEGHASRGCLGYQVTALIRDFTLHVANNAAAPHDFALGSQASLPNGPKEIDLQFHGRKRFLRRKCAREGHSHRGVSDVTKNPAVQRPHGIGVLWSSRQDDRSSSIGNLFGFESNQTGHRHVVGLRPRPKSGFKGASGILMTLPPESSREYSFRDIPRDDSMQNRGRRLCVAAGLPSSPLRA